MLVKILKEMFLLQLTIFNLFIRFEFILSTEETSDTEVQSPFPASTFFNTTEDTMTKYLCQKRENEKKCCSCNPWMFEEGRCIDVFWDNTKSYSLNEYLKELESKVNVYTSNKPCRSLIPFKNYDSEQYRIKSKFYNATTKKYHDCHQSTGNKIIPLVWVRDGGLYINKQCALADDDVNLRDCLNFDVSVTCKDVDILQENMIFDLDMESKLKDCSFKIAASSPSEVLHDVKSMKCSHKKNNCKKGSKYYNLCNAYYAPTQGYENKHCYMCDKNVNSKIPFNGECKDLSRTVYVGDDTVIEPPTLEEEAKSVSQDERHSGVRFDLVASTNDEWIIKHLKYSFPISKFLGISDTNMTYLYSRFMLCGSSNENKERLCDCDDECVKYKTCCSDKFWNISKPVTEHEYKSMFRKNLQGYKDQKCENIPPSQLGNNTKRYYMVISCLPTSKRLLKEKCLNANQSDLVPVLGSDSYLYKNEFCALCNFVYVSSPVYVKCADDISGLNKTTNCTWVITSRSVSIRTCTDKPLSIGNIYKFHSNFYRFKREMYRHDSIRRRSFEKCSSDELIQIFVICKIKSLKTTEEIMRRISEFFNKTKSEVNIYHKDGNKVIFCIQEMFTISRLNETLKTHMFKPYTVRENNESVIFTPLVEPMIKALNRSYNQHNHENEACFELTSNSLIYFSDCDCNSSNTTTNAVWVLFKWSDDEEDSLKCHRNELKYECNNSNNKKSRISDASFRIKHSSSKRFTTCSWQSAMTKGYTVLLTVDSSLSLIGSLINILFYSLFIFIYYRLNDIRSMYGIGLLSLVLSLLLAEVMYFLAMVLRLSGNDENLPLCKLIAITLHFCLLKTHIWNIIVTYDLLTLYTNLSFKRLHQYSYVILAFTVTFCLVLISFLFDQFDVISIGYGDNGICVPHKFYGQLLFQIIPAALSTLVSLIFLRLLSRKIKKSSDMDHRSRNKTRVALLVFKCTIVLAVSEGIGFISVKSPTKANSDITIYMISNALYILARSLRGIVFFVCFYAFEKSVSSLYKGSLHGRVSTVREHIAMWSDSRNGTPELPHREIPLRQLVGHKI